MTNTQAVFSVIDALDAAGIPYVLVGSYASNSYGIDRSTQDADFVFQPSDQSIASLFQGLRPAILFNPQIEFETVTMTRRHVAKLADSPFKIELFYLGEDPHDVERMRRRRLVDYADRKVYVLSVEDVIVTKLRWARSKDKDDIAAVIVVQEGKIDWEYVYSWADRHGTRTLLDEIRRSIPPI